MIGLFAISLAIAMAASLAVFSLMYRHTIKRRLVVAAAIFLQLTFSPIALIIAIGDQVPEDAQLVTKEDLERAAGRKP